MLELAPRRSTWARQYAWFWLVAAVLGVMMLAPSILAPYDPYSLDVSNRFLPPSWEHPFGTDDTGRDIFSRVIHGARYSLGATVLVVTCAAAIGTLYGAVSAYVGGRVDRVMMRAVDVFLAFPYLVFAMAVAASLGRGLRSTIVALLILWWPSYARMVRGQVKSVLNDYHVMAAKSLGPDSRQLLQWHVIPHVADEVAVRYTLDLGNVLVALTGLSFLGLGATPPLPEWGRMIADAKQFALTAWWYAVLPGLVVFLVVLTFVLFGERLRDRRSRA